MPRKKKIFIVFSEDSAPKACELLSALEEKECTQIRSEKGLFELETLGSVSEDSAIIFVSDEAVYDENWKEKFKSLPDETRKIPIGEIVDADYSDTNLLPEEIEKINFIKNDSYFFSNIWESLTVESDFYQLKNEILSNMSSWIVSESSDVFLMDNYKTIVRSEKLFSKKLKSENDEYFIRQLEELLKYLSLSRKNTIINSLKILMKRLSAIAVLVLIIGCIYLFSVTLPYSQRAKTAVYTLSTQKSSDMAPISAIKALDALENPLISSTLKPELYSFFRDCYDQNWQNTPISVNYKWALNAGEICSDERYLITAKGNGNAALWDTFSGEIKNEYKIAEVPLSGIALSEDESVILVSDSEGFLYLKQNDGDWIKSRTSFDIPFLTSTKLKCSNQLAAVKTDSKLLSFEINNGNITQTAEFSFDSVLCFELQNGEINAAVKENNKVFCIKIKGSEITEKIVLPYELKRSSTISVRENRFLFADKNGALAIFSPDGKGTAEYIGTTLSNPVCLCFFNNDIIVYCDRDLGTNLYSVKDKCPLDRIINISATIESLDVKGSTVLAVGEGLYYTENVKDLLPNQSIKQKEIKQEYSEPYAESEGIIKKIYVKKDYVIIMELKAKSGSSTVVIDGGKRCFTGASQFDKSFFDGITEYQTYLELPFSFNGKPTVIGINSDKNTAVFATSDGRFFELYIDEEGNSLLIAQRKLPNCAEIVKIITADSGYYIEDKLGNVWYKKSGKATIDPEERKAAVKERLHMAMADDVYDIASKKLVKELDIKLFPGHDGKEWE